MEATLRKVVRVRTEKEAVTALADAGPDARVIAGGTDLMLQLAKGHRRVDTLVDIRRCNMRSIEQRDGLIELGATTTVDDLTRSDVIRHRLPALHRAALAFASPQIRNMATVGGNIGNASPAADLVPPLIVSGAVATIRSASGAREAPLAELFKGPGTTSIEPGELITRVRLEPIGADDHVREFFEKLGFRKAQVISVVNFALRSRIVKGVLTGVKVCFGSVGPTPIVASQVQDSLENHHLSEQLIFEAVAAVIRDITPIDDVRASRAYRIAVSAGYLYKALVELWKKPSP